MSANSTRSLVISGPTLLALFLLAVLLPAGCSGCGKGGGGGGSTDEIKIDGSSTVAPITKKVFDEFTKKQGFEKVNVSIAISGTGGGFKKFSAGETDISNASRAIKPAEKEACDKNKIDYLELKVGIDGLAVIIHPDNTWAEKMTVAQLKKIWHPDTAAKKWSDVDTKWPPETIRLFGPGADSGTFDYFTEAINGKEDVCRSDFDSSEDDNIIVKGVAGNKYALGYLGVAYYEQNKDKLKEAAIAAKDGDSFVAPTRDNVLSGKYKPLSRPLFIYVKTESLKRPVIQEFCQFYLRRSDLVESVGYVKLEEEAQIEQQQKLDAAIKAAK